MYGVVTHDVCVDVVGSYPADHMKCYKAKSMKDERSLMAAVDEENVLEDGEGEGE